jgi:gp16 family phage-associated protein
MSSESVRTPTEARAWLDRHGVTVSAWARARGFEPSVVFALLNGRTRGRWGKAYEAAVALGLRARPHLSERYPLAPDAESPSAASQLRNTIPGEAAMT